MTSTADRRSTILFTNHALAGRGGTELYVRDLAVALRGRGYRTLAYSPNLGEVAEELADLGVPVMGDLAALPEPPDLIHGHHHLGFMTATLAFPHVPAVYVCHGTKPWEEYPPSSPSIRAYVAVSDATRTRVVDAVGVPPAEVITIPNFVDVRRFPPRTALPASPRSVLIMSNRATADGFAGEAARVCRERGLRVTMHGSDSGSPVADPSAPLSEADVVVAAGRTALEAMATGCAVILADTWGMGGLVTPENFEALRRGNFGRQTSRGPCDHESVAAELDRYDPVGSRAVTRRVREEAGMEAAVDRWEQVYASIQQTAPVDPTSVARAAADYLAGESAWVRRGHEWDRTVATLEEHAAALTERLDSALSDLAQYESRLAEAESLNHSLQQRSLEQPGIRESGRGLARALRRRAAKAVADRAALQPDGDHRSDPERSV